MALTNSSGVYCPTVKGISWTLFREKCYYRYSAPFGIDGVSKEDAEKNEKFYKTWFEAREECAKLGAKLASVHDQATHEKLLQLIAGNETVKSLEESTWIGLQVGRPHKVNGEYETGCWWPADACPRLMEDDPDPNNTVDKCSITYNKTFHGQWEDGKMYTKTESADFWAPGEPSYEDKNSCQGVINVDEQSQAYCERGPNGKPDLRRHCAQILPADEKQIPDEGNKPYAGKWMVFWCWIKSRGYICERPAKRSDESEKSTTPTFTSSGAETQTPAAITFCGTRLDDCRKRAWRRINEIERGIKDTTRGYSQIINTVVLGNADPGAPWAPAPFEKKAQFAVNFGRNVAKLSAEVCSRPVMTTS